MDANTEADHRKKRVEKYFRETPDRKRRTLAIIRISASIAGFLLAMIMLGGGSDGFGIFFLAVSGYGGYKGTRKMINYYKEYSAAEPKPSDEEMDHLLGGDLEKICNLAMKELDLTLDQIQLFEKQPDPVANLCKKENLEEKIERPMLVFGPSLPSRMTAVGKDGISRFADYNILVICPTNYHLALYQTEVDFLTGGFRYENTDEYHYDDVVAVSTNTAPADVDPEQSQAEFLGSRGGEWNSPKKLTLFQVVGLITSPVKLFAFFFRLLNLRGGGGPMDSKVRGDTTHFSNTLYRRFMIEVSSGHSRSIVVNIENAELTYGKTGVRLHDSGINGVISCMRKVLKDKKGGSFNPSRKGNRLPSGGS